LKKKNAGTIYSIPPAGRVEHDNLKDEQILLLLLFSWPLGLLYTPLDILKHPSAL